MQHCVPRDDKSCKHLQSRRTPKPLDPAFEEWVWAHQAVGWFLLPLVHGDMSRASRKPADKYLHNAIPVC